MKFGVLSEALVSVLCIGNCSVQLSVPYLKGALAAAEMRWVGKPHPGVVSWVRFLLRGTWAFLPSFLGQPMTVASLPFLE